MKTARKVLFLIALCLIGSMLATPARADTWNKKTVVTFNEPIEIPGKVLPAGTYMFKLLDSNSNRNIVQVWNEDGTELITTVLAISDYRLEATGETVIKYQERPGEAPNALRAWFYPGDLFGREFVYPEKRALELAAVSHETVPAETVEPTSSNLETLPIVAVTPEKKEVPVSEAIQTTPLPTQEKEAPAKGAVMETKELPKTASSIPLIALFGLASLGLAFALKALAK